MGDSGSSTDSSSHSDATTKQRATTTTPSARPSSGRSSTPSDGTNPRGELAKTIPRRPRVSWWLGLVFAFSFAIFVTPSITADRWLAALGVAATAQGEAAPVTVRIPPFAGQKTIEGDLQGGGVVIARGSIATRDQAADARRAIESKPAGPLPYIAYFMLAFVLAALFSHHMRRSTYGRLLRVQLVSLATIALLAVVIEIVMLTTAVSVLVVPVALLAMVPTMVLDRIVGLATGVLGALVTSLLVPFDVTVAILLLVQAASAGLVVAERPKRRWRAALLGGGVSTLFTTATYLLLMYLTTGTVPGFTVALDSPWLAVALGPAIATLLAVPLIPLYQLVVGEITLGRLIVLEDLSNPLLRQIAEKSPGTWQHSLAMANMAEIAANAIGANGRLVRVGAYYHDLGKSLQPKYFIENLEPGETSPHDQLPPEVSCDAIFAHVTEGIVAARKAGLHERIVDFMHMHHGNGVLEYFWGKTREQGNPRGLSIEQFRYPGHPPQTRETAILAICDAVEAASRTLKKPDATAIDSLVQRIVYGKLHLGQLDESGLSMSDLRRLSDSLRDTVRHANHGRIEYPWQKAQSAVADATASAASAPFTQTGPRLDSLDRPGHRDTALRPALIVEPDSTADTTPLLKARGPQTPDSPELASPDATASEAVHMRAQASSEDLDARRRNPTKTSNPPPSRNTGQEALADTANHLAILETAPAMSRAQLGVDRDSDGEVKPLTTIRGHEPPTAARKRAATLPPTPIRRAPTVPPPVISRRASSNPPVATVARSSGPPLADDLDNAVTNPPPMRGTPANASSALGAVRLPGIILGANANEAPLTLDAMSSRDDDVADTQRRDAVEPPPDSMADSMADSMGDTDEAARTTPIMQRAMPLPAPAASNPQLELPKPPWAKSLAERIDAAIERDEWGVETPVVAPSRAELRALLGHPDPTRKQSIDELEALRTAAEALPSDPEIVLRRPTHLTSEVDPDQIEAAIELAPPARQRTPNVVGVAKKSKKSE